MSKGKIKSMWVWLEQTKAKALTIIGICGIVGTLTLWFWKGAEFFSNVVETGENVKKMMAENRLQNEKLSQNEVDHAVIRGEVRALVEKVDVIKSFVVPHAHKTGSENENTVRIASKNSQE